MKKTIFFMAVLAMIAVVMPRPAQAQDFYGSLLSRDAQAIDDGSFVVKVKAELIYADNGQPIIGYGDFSRVNPVPLSGFTALKINITPIGAVEIDKKTGMPEAELLASWDANQPFHELLRTGNGGWEAVIPLGRREPGTLSFTAQVVAVTGKRKTKYRVLFITIPFLGKKVDINKVVANSIDFECFDYTEDRSEDPKSVALWVKDMIGVTTAQFAGTMPRFDLTLGLLPSDSPSAAPATTSVPQPAPAKVFDLLPGTGAYDGKVILKALQDVDRTELTLLSGDQVVESKTITARAGQRFAVDPSGLTGIQVGGQSWSLREE